MMFAVRHRIVAALVLCAAAAASGHAQTYPTPEQIRKSQEAYEGAQKALAGKRDDPCHPVLVEKEAGRRFTGSNLPWLVCKPVRITVTWDLTETQRGGPNLPHEDSLAYTLHETYTGYARINYDPDDRRRIMLMKIAGPSPAGSAKAELRRVKGYFFGTRGSGAPPPAPPSDPGHYTGSGDPATISRRVTEAMRSMLWDPGPPTGRFPVSSPEMFTVDGRSSSFAFDYTAIKGAPALTSTWIHGAEAGVQRERLVGPKGRLSFGSLPDQAILPNPKGISAKAGFTIDDIREAMGRGVISKRFPMKSEIAFGSFPAFSRQGEATVTIAFRTDPGTLAVAPKEDYRARGPDAKGRYTPAQKEYTLRNAGTEPIGYRAAADKAWVRVTPGAGTLDAGASTRVAVAVDAKAKRAKNDRAAKVRFVNATNGRGNTERKVIIAARERWRVTIEGWNALLFGDRILGGGIKAYWRTVVEFEVEDGKLENGSGRAEFAGYDRHSTPPGVYDCVVLEGTYLDAALKRHPTPYIRHRSFAVSGTVRGRSATFTLPAGNLYVVGYHCTMDSDRALEAFRGKDYVITPENRVRHSRKASTGKDARPLPSGSRTVTLKDGWSHQEGRTASMDAHRIRVQRLK